MTTVEWLVEEINKLTGLKIRMDEPIIEKAKKMEIKEKLKYQLYIGKVSDVIGFEKALNLLKEVNEEIR
jgi:hypothetical protein